MVEVSEEKQEWRALADKALAGNIGPDKLPANIRSNLKPMFSYYAGTYLAAKGRVGLGRQWVAAGALTEEVSFFIQPRGARNDYHMLKTQWHELFGEVLAPDFACLCDSACYADEYTGFFTMHYGR